MLYAGGQTRTVTKSLLNILCMSLKKKQISHMKFTYLGMSKYIPKYTNFVYSMSTQVA